MKVLMILSNFPDDNDPVSGIFYKRIVDELINRGIKIIIISPKSHLRDFIKSKDILNFRKIEQKKNGPQIFRPTYLPIPARISNPLKVYLLRKSIINCIKKHQLTFDIVDSRSAFPWCYIGYNIAKEYSKPAFSTFIGSDINVQIFSSRYIFNCVKKVVNNTTTIAVSSELKKKTEENFPGKSVHLIYDGIDYQELESTLRERPKFTSAKSLITVGFVGQLTREKGCKTLLEIIKKTGSIYNWILIGDGPMSTSFKANKNVHLTGKISPVAVFDYYQKLDVFLFPSKNEGIPNVLKEASFFEIPIIASAVGGIPEMTNEGKFATLVEDYENADAYVKALNDFRTDKSEYFRKAKLLKDFTKERFDISITIEKLISLYSLNLSPGTFTHVGY